MQLALDLLARPTPENLLQARGLLDQAVALQRRIDPEHPGLDDMLLACGKVARAQGDHERARRGLDEALGRLRRHHGGKDSRTVEARAALASL
ncbi:MAG: tetratricopeptide repeat protein [Acidobacteriota bacterium]